MQQESNITPGSVTSIILVVTRYGRFAEPVMDYAVNVADRLQCKLLAAYVNTLPQLWNDAERLDLRDQAINNNVELFQAKAKARGVSLDHVRESGRISKVINRLCHIVRRIEFVVIDKGIKMEEVSSRVPIPVFNVFYVNPPLSEDSGPASPLACSSSIFNKTTVGNARFYMKTGLCCLVLCAIFALTLHSPELIVDNWKQGGIRMAVPLLFGTTALFAFSFLFRNISLMAKFYIGKGRELTQAEDPPSRAGHVNARRKVDRQSQPRI